MTLKIFVNRVFTIFATNTTYLRGAAVLEIVKITNAVLCHDFNESDEMMVRLPKNLQKNISLCQIVNITHICDHIS